MIFIENEMVWCSYQFLEKYISKKTIEDWQQRKICVRQHIKGIVFIEFESIPTPSRAKLPAIEELWALARQQERDARYQFYRNRTDMAILENFSVHRAYLLDTYGKSIKLSTLNTIARKWCVVNELFVKKGIRHGELNYVQQVLNDLFDNWFSDKGSLSRFRNRVLKDGIEPNLVYFRLFRRKGRIIKFSLEMQERFMYYYSDDRQYSIPVIREKLMQEFDDVPTETTLKKKAIELRNDPAIYAARYGKKAADGQLPYQRLKPPKYINSKWEIDGWTMPFYTIGEKDGKTEKFQRWVMVRVMDLCSRKILALQVAQSESSHIILKTLEDAIRKTGHVPAELVMDLHSGTKTDDFVHFEKHVSLLGTKVVKTFKATGKAVIERYNIYLDSIAKDYPEWLGQNISAKMPVRRSDETVRELVKTENHLSYDETIARGYIIAKQYNEMELRPLHGLTPEVKYEEAEKRGITVAESNINAMFAPAKEYSILRGMITIRRGTKMNTYTLPTNLYKEHNNQRVLVHSFDIDECIYVFDMEGNHIVDMQPDEAINSSLTEREAEEKPKQFGIAKGIEKRASKAFEDLKNNPESASFVPSYMINKSAYQEIQRSATIAQIAKIEGLKAEKKFKPAVHIPGETVYNLSDPELNNNDVALLPDAKDFLFQTKKG